MVEVDGDAVRTDPDALAGVVVLKELVLSLVTSARHHDRAARSVYRPKPRIERIGNGQYTAASGKKSIALISPQSSAEKGQIRELAASYQLPATHHFTTATFLEWDDSGDGH